AGFSGIRDSDLATLMETGTSTHTGYITPGPYMNTYGADIVLLHIGTNDILANDYNSVADVARILDAIDDYETSRGNPVVVFVAQIISRQGYACGADPRVPTFNMHIKNLVDSRKATGDHLVMVDMECDAGINYSTELMDQVHPGQVAYDKMADLWFQAINNYNTAPMVTQIPEQKADRGEAFNTLSLDGYVYDVEDLDADITWTVVPTPTHFTVTINSSRVATITPKDPQWSGSEVVEFVATDNGKVVEELAKSGTSLTTLTVNWIPEIIGQEEVTIAEGQSHEVTLDDLVLVEQEKAPVGATVTVIPGANYTVVGQTITPATNFNGQLQVPVRVTANGHTTDAYTLLVEVSGVNHAPEIQSTPSTTIKSGHSYSYQMVVSDLDPEDVLAYSATVKPSWMTVDASTGLVTGVPSRSHAGPNNVTLRVWDGAAQDLQSFVIEVQYYNFAPVVTSDPADTAFVGHNYIYGISATDQENDNLTYYAHSKPDWLSFSPASHVLIGTPTDYNRGTNLVTLGVTDGIDTTFQTFNVTVVRATAVEDPSSLSGIRVYPNPVTDQVAVDLSESFDPSQEVRFQLVDLTGRTVYGVRLDDRTTTIDLRHTGLSDGMYLYRISGVNETRMIQTGRLMLRLER
ncbi:MAG: putative Ig domain-containing protein, partial [Bacteroidales bacterium]